ncbi:hypothetical protein BH10BAC2_BH10BAC2_19970 [soil metagenome]
MGLTEQVHAIKSDGFSVLLEQLKEHAVFLLDPAGKVISSSKNAEQITGYTAKEMKGKPVSFFFNDAAIEQGNHLFAIEYARQNSTYTNEHSFFRKDGIEIFCAICISGLPDENNTIKNFTLTLAFISKGVSKINEAFHLARLIARTKDAIFSTDLSFNMLSWNEAAEKMYGYSMQEVLGRPFREVVCPQISAEIFKEIDESVTRYGYWAGEVIHLTKNNLRIEIDESISITKDIQDRHDGYVWVCRDNTVVKHKEEQLLHLAKLIENTNDAIYTASSDNLILSWNNAAEKMYGYTRDEAINQSAEKILQPQIAIERRSEIRVHIEQQQHWKGEIIHKRKDGSLLPVLISVNIIKNRNNVVEEFICICSDISELKRNEESLRRMQEKITLLTQQKLDKSLKEIEDYKYALDASSIVDITDTDGTIQYVNNNFCTLSKYTSEELIGNNHSIVNSGFHPPEFMEDMWATIAAGKIWNGEVKNKAKDGAYYWVEATIVPFIGDYGKPYQYLEIGVNITEKKKTEEAFRRSEEMRDLILKSALDAIVGIDEKGNIIMWNTQAEKIFGWPQKEVMGQYLSEIIIPEHHREAHTKGLEYYLKTGEGTVLNKVIEITALNSNNIEFPIELAIVPIKQDGSEFFCAFIRDITERKTWQERLLQERGLLRILIDNIPEYIYVKDLQYKHVINNAANVTLIGALSETETLGKTVFDYFKPELAEQFMEDDKKILQTGATIINREELIASENGKERWLLTTKVPLKDAAQNIIGLLGISRDITEQKRSALQLLKEKELSDSIINSLPGIFYLYGGNNKFLRWNKQFEIVTGYSKEEISQMSPDLFFVRNDINIVYEKIKAAFSEGIADAEANVITKSGEKIPYYLTGVLTRYDDMPCIIGTGINISNRKKAEKELYDSEQKYKMLFERNPLPMWMFTIPERNIIEVNNAAISHYGYTREEFLSLNLLDLRPEEDKDVFIQETKQAVTGIRRAGVWRHKKKDGTIIHVEIFRDDIVYKGREVRLVLINDISDKFITEQRLKESYEELRNLASHLQDVREEERAVIAREIHDELGQQITGLKMDVSWISKRILTEDANIHQKVKNVLQLLDETVKTVRKIATELRPSILDDLGLIDALQWYSFEFEKRYGIAVSFHTTVEEVSLLKNVAIGLFRIYQESLTNVARHANASFVKTDFTIDAGTLRLTITDNGKGFDTGKSESKKTLGLLGMKERTLMMGGIYVINSIPGKGTTVYISVPMQTTNL